MTLIAEDSPVMAKLMELCITIAESPRFQDLQRQMSAFYEDEAAKQMYMDVHSKGSSLNEKQRAGVELGEVEIMEFENAREELHQNPTAHGFIEAQGEFEMLHRATMQYIGMTLELGRVPTEEDLAGGGGGCCGGSCGCGEGGGGCGCGGGGGGCGCSDGGGCGCGG